MKRILLASALFGSLLFSGCAVRTAYVGGPPPPPVEYYGVAPGPGYYWTPGVYVRAHGRYDWHRGYWAQRGHRR